MVWPQAAVTHMNDTIYMNHFLNSVVSDKTLPHYVS